MKKEPRIYIQHESITNLYTAKISSRRSIKMTDFKWDPNQDVNP